MFVLDCFLSFVNDAKPTLFKLHKELINMHRCLCIPEILTTIFEEVKNERGELGALATTCKTFSGPAVAILWRTLLTPVPLLLAMPSDLLELEEIPQKDDKDDHGDGHVHLSKLVVSLPYFSSLLLHDVNLSHAFIW